MHDMQVLLLCVAGIGALCFGLVPMGLHFKVAQRKREMEHLERMKALELGRPFLAPETELMRCMAGRIAFSIGAGVPIGVFGCAWLASETVGYHEPIWIAAGMVGLGGVICGTVLAGTLFSSTSASSTSQSSGSFDRGKPLVDEDAYDVVSARG